MSEPKPDVSVIIAALRYLHKNYSCRESWAFFSELRVGTGFGRDSQQSIDAFAIALWPSDHWASHAYEIKVSRADFLKELREPIKRRAALRYSNMFWFATPEGLVRPEEIPVEAGLMEVRWRSATAHREAGWQPVVALSAPWRDIPPPTWNLFASVARRVQRIEQNGRSLSSEAT